MSATMALARSPAVAMPAPITKRSPGIGMGTPASLISSRPARPAMAMASTDGRDVTIAGVTHPLVEQVHFTRAEWRRALRGISEEDGSRKIEPINTIGWTVGHLAWQ